MSHVKIMDCTIFVCAFAANEAINRYPHELIFGIHIDKTKSMSDQLKTRKASDLDASQAIGGSDTTSLNASSSFHVSKKAKREPSMFLRMLDSILISKTRGKYDDYKYDAGAFDSLLNRFELGEIQEVEEAIKYDITVVDNFWNYIGYSLLAKAVMAGLINLVRVLLKHAGKSLMKPLNEDSNPLLQACARGRVEIVKLLLEHGFDPNLMCSDQYYTCLTTACMQGHTAVVRLLLEYGAAPDQANQGYETPLGYACQNGRLDIVRLLLNGGASVNLVNSYGNTHLITALLYQQDDTDLIQLLLERGADPAIPDEYGRTALDLVTKGSELAEMLINAQSEHILK